MSDPTARQYAEEHRRFLEENNPGVLDGLRQSGSLDSYLSSVGEEASQMFDHLMNQYHKSPEVQNLPYHDRVRALQSRRSEAQELVRHDLINQPVPAE
jgi:Transposon-encoded protein TnpV